MDSIENWWRWGATQVNGFWSRLESWWNTSKAVAWIAVAFGVALVTWAASKPRSPGISIGLLALAAGLMSVRPKMHFPEKITWVAVLVTLTCLEVRAIKRSDAENAAIRDKQNAAFRVIVDDLKTSIQNGKDQYTRTIEHVDTVSDHVDGVAKTTQQVAEVAHSDLLAVTGGDSYAYVYPTAVLGSDRVLLKIHNDGDETLDLRVEIARIVDESAEHPCDGRMGTPAVFPIGPVADHEGRIIQGSSFSPTLPPGGAAYYQIWINAQNHGVSENLYFRKVSANPYWEYRFTVERPVADHKRMRTDAKACGIWIRWLKKRDWTTTYMQSDVENPGRLKY